MKMNKLCSHCGTFNQLEIQYEPDDKSWQVQCLVCSHIMPVSKEELPPRISSNPSQYSVPDIQSIQDAHSMFSISDVSVLKTSYFGGRFNDS